MIRRLTAAVTGNGIAAMATAMGALSWVAFAFGVAYTIDCRSLATNWDQAEGCYLTGGSMAGVGGLGRAAQGMFTAGYNTYNPSLRTRTAPTDSPVDNPDDPQG